MVPYPIFISGFRWAFYGQSDVGVVISLGMILLFMAVCVAIIGWIFKTGWRLRT